MWHSATHSAVVIFWHRRQRIRVVERCNASAAWALSSLTLLPTRARVDEVPLNSSQTTTNLDIDSSYSSLHSFLGQTRRLHHLLLSLVPFLHASLSHSLVLWLQPVPCITLTPTSPLVGHSGAALGTGTSLHP